MVFDRSGGKVMIQDWKYTHPIIPIITLILVLCYHGMSDRSVRSI